MSSAALSVGPPVRARNRRDRRAYPYHRQARSLDAGREFGAGSGGDRELVMECARAHSDATHR